MKKKPKDLPKPNKIESKKIESQKYAEEILRLFFISVAVSSFLLAIFIMYFKTMF